MRFFRNYKFLLVLVIGIAGALRFVKLGSVPLGFTHDELGYVWNSYSIALTGRNVFGEFLPMFTWMTAEGFPFLPVSTYMAVPLYWVVSMSPFVARFIYALMGTIDVLLLYYIVKTLFNRKDLAMIASFLFAISPWHLHFSRSAFDTNFSVFFYLAAIAAYMYEIKKQKLPFVSVLSLFMAVFSYRGMNALFPFLVLLLFWYGWVSSDRSRKFLVFFGAGAALVVAVFMLTVFHYGDKYIAEAVVDKGVVQREIDSSIRESRGPLPIRRLFLNKPKYYLSQYGENYLRVYSPEFLALYTEANQVYSVWSRGRIYALNYLLAFIGVIYLYKLNKRGGIFISGLLLAGGIPGMVGGLPYSARTMFLSAIFPVLAAGGIYYFIDIVSLKIWKMVTVIAFILIYSYLLGGYLFDYYGRYAHTRAEVWFKSMRDIGEIIQKEKDNYDYVVVGKVEFADFIQYAFYSGMNPADVQKTWKKHSEEGKKVVRWNNIVFSPVCVDKQTDNILSSSKIKSWLYITRNDCGTATPSAKLVDFDRNTIWKIYKNLEVEN